MRQRKDAGKTLARVYVWLMAPHRGLKAWQHAQRLAVECSRVARRLPRHEQPALASQLRQAAYTVAVKIARGAGGSGEARRCAFETAQSCLAEIDTILGIAHDLGYLPSRDYARLEAWSEETAKMVFGLRRKSADARDPATELGPSAGSREETAVSHTSEFRPGRSARRPR